MGARAVTPLQHAASICQWPQVGAHAAGGEKACGQCRHLIGTNRELLERQRPSAWLWVSLRSRPPGARPDTGFGAGCALETEALRTEIANGICKRKSCKREMCGERSWQAASTRSSWSAISVPIP